MLVRIVHGLCNRTLYSNALPLRVSLLHIRVSFLRAFLSLLARRCRRVKKLTHTQTSDHLADELKAAAQHGQLCALWVHTVIAIANPNEKACFMIPLMKHQELLPIQSDKPLLHQKNVSVMIIRLQNVTINADATGPRLDKGVRVIR